MGCLINGQFAILSLVSFPHSIQGKEPRNQSAMTSLYLPALAVCRLTAIQINEEEDGQCLFVIRAELRMQFASISGL